MHTHIPTLTLTLTLATLPRSLAKGKISAAKNAMLSPAAYEMHPEADPNVSKVFALYDATLRRRNCVDFDDMLLLPLALLRHDMDALAKYRGKFTHVG